MEEKKHVEIPEPGKKEESEKPEKAWDTQPGGTAGTITCNTNGTNTTSGTSNSIKG